MGSQVAEKRSGEMIQAKRTMASLTRKVLFSEELDKELLLLLGRKCGRAGPAGH